MIIEKKNLNFNRSTKDTVGDGFCDEPCRQVGSDGKALCTVPEKPNQFDGGDCVGCAPGCATEFVGDGQCQDECNVPRCNYDMLDCKVKIIV